MRLIFRTTDRFSDWLASIQDRKVLARLLDRLERAQWGNFGDTASVGDGISEMRIHTGPGYRIYFARQAQQIYILLAAGDKSSQSRDIVEARKMWSLIRKERA